MKKIRLGVNIDHVATVRNARGGVHPDPILAAKIAKKAGADGITAHLREDRRHISDLDIKRIKEEVDLPLNLEMAATKEMLEIALKTMPHSVCLVPEKRAELTTEGGLDVISYQKILIDMIKELKRKKIRISLFVDPSLKQIATAKKIGADIVELHTGNYCRTNEFDQKEEFKKIAYCAAYTNEIDLECHAGHGLNFDTAEKISAIPEIAELNIGHFLIGEAIFIGLDETVKKMKKAMEEGRKSAIY